MRYHHVSLPFYSDFIEVEAVRLGILVIKIISFTVFFSKEFLSVGVRFSWSILYKFQEQCYQEQKESKGDSKQDGRVLVLFQNVVIKQLAFGCIISLDKGIFSRSNAVL